MLEVFFIGNYQVGQIFRYPYTINIDKTDKKVRVNRMYLSHVTLCCVDNRYPNLGFQAIERTCKEMDFAEVLFFTNTDFLVPASHEIKNLKTIPLSHIRNMSDYSHFMIKELNQYIRTSHVLTIQWDGFVINSDAWKDEYLKYDYIGAPWPFETGTVVGNGGFSLRSKKLLEALQDGDIKDIQPEDQCICITNKELLKSRYQIDIAPVELAEKFAFEFSAPLPKSFGFHGFFHFPKFLNDEELCSFIKDMPESSVLGPYIKIFVQDITRNSSRKVNQALHHRLMDIINNSAPIIQSPSCYGFLRGLLKSGQLSLSYALFKRRMKLVGMDMKFFKLIFRFIPGFFNNIGYKLMRLVKKSHQVSEKRQLSI